MVIAANGNDQPDTPIKSERMFEHIKGIDWTGPKAATPHMLTNTKIWSVHYGMRPHSPNMIMEDLRIHHTTYGVYRPAFDNQVYRDVHLSELGPEPFNRGMDDTSAQWGTITVDGLILEDMGRGNDHHPVVHMTDNNLSGKAECHFRNVTVRGGDVRRPIFNRGGSARSDRMTPEGVPYILHDHFGPGADAKVVALPTERKDQGEAARDAEKPPMIGKDAEVSRVGDIEFPELLAPVDEEPPATVILSVARGGSDVLVHGVTHDNGVITKVLVNEVEAKLTRTSPGVVDWTVVLPKGTTKIEAGALDEAGNKELTPHRID